MTRKIPRQTRHAARGSTQNAVKGLAAKAGKARRQRAASEAVAKSKEAGQPDPAEALSDRALTTLASDALRDLGLTPSPTMLGHARLYIAAREAGIAACRRLITSPDPEGRGPGGARMLLQEANETVRVLQELGQRAAQPATPPPQSAPSQQSAIAPAPATPMVPLQPTNEWGEPTA